MTKIQPGIVEERLTDEDLDQLENMETEEEKHITHKRSKPIPPPTPIFDPLELKYLEDCVITKISAYQINIKRTEKKGNFDSKNARELPDLQKLLEKIKEMKRNGH